MKIKLSIAMESVHLPDDVKWFDFGEGPKIMPQPSSAGTYLTTSVSYLLKAADGKHYVSGIEWTQDQIQNGIEQSMVDMFVNKALTNFVECDSPDSLPKPASGSTHGVPLPKVEAQTYPKPEPPKPVTPVPPTPTPKPEEKERVFDAVVTERRPEARQESEHAEVT